MRSAKETLFTRVSFDAIPVGVDCEGSVVARAIVWSQAWSAIIGTSHAECGGMERIDRLTRRRSEGEMKI
jgi:hypothetical protein